MISVRRLAGTSSCFASARADGRTPTPAAWIRGFVRSHADYRGDSVVPDSIQYDLVQEVLKMEGDTYVSR